VVPGLTLSDARARLPGLASTEIDRAADAEALRGLVLWMTRWSPVAAVDGADGAMLDITGCAHLFGGESAMLGAVSGALDRAGVAHRLAIAATPGAAWALARTGRERLSLIEGPTGPGIADLPVSGLRLSDETLALLRRFGITRIGQLAELDRRALARRFRSRETAERVVTRLDQALGAREEPLAPLSPAAEYTARLPCPEPILHLDGLRAGLARLMADLARDLETAGTGGRRFAFRAFRGDGTVAELAVATARPVRDAEHVLHLFRDRIEALDPGFGVDFLALEATETAAMADTPAPLSPDLGGGGIDTAALAALADRLAARLGREAVLVAEPGTRHGPEESARLAPFAGALPDWAATAPRNWKGTDAAPDDPAAPAEAARLPDRPPRLLDPPEPLDVLAGIPEGPPMRFLWRRVMRRVKRADGPERIGPDWWRAAAGADRPPRTRDYYRVEDADGRRYWLFREGLYGDGRGGMPGWYLHGLGP
jgi:protein ImuB